MLFGVHIFPTEYAIRIDELARAAEERGFESLFATEHTHIPKSRRTPWRSGPRTKYRACRMRRPPVLNSRCWRLVRDQLWMARGRTSRRRRLPRL